jgi:hypothetical protein
MSKNAGFWYLSRMLSMPFWQPPRLQEEFESNPQLKRQFRNVQAKIWLLSIPGAIMVFGLVAIMQVMGK